MAVGPALSPGLGGRWMSDMWVQITADLNFVSPQGSRAVVAFVWPHSANCHLFAYVECNFISNHELSALYYYPLCLHLHGCIAPDLWGFLKQRKRHIQKKIKYIINNGACLHYFFIPAIIKKNCNHFKNKLLLL
jgi:hypothetical protein